MIECNMPQDILKYEPKVISGLTARQLVFGGIGVAVILASFFALFKGVSDTSLRIVYSALLAIPFFAFGFLKIYGLPLEKSLTVIFVDNFIKPAKRPTKTEYPELAKWEKSRCFQPDEQIISPYNELLPEEERLTKIVLTEKEMKKLKKEKRFTVKRSNEYPPIY